MRHHGILATGVSLVVGGAGILLSAHWAYRIIHPGPVIPLLSLSNALFNYMGMGIGEMAGLFGAFYLFRRAHIGWALGTLVLGLLVAAWIAGTILLIQYPRPISSMPFTYPVPIVLLGLWIGMIIMRVLMRRPPR